MGTPGEWQYPKYPLLRFATDETAFSPACSLSSIAHQIFFCEDFQQPGIKSEWNFRYIYYLTGTHIKSYATIIVPDSLPIIVLLL